VSLLLLGGAGFMSFVGFYMVWDALNDWSGESTVASEKSGSLLRR
jgi:hypothetical protein